MPNKNPEGFGPQGPENSGDINSPTVGFDSTIRINLDPIQKEIKQLRSIKKRSDVQENRLKELLKQEKKWKKLSKKNSQK